MQFHIRLATPTDAARCAEIHEKSWYFAYNDSVPAEILKQYTARFPMLWDKLLAKNTDTQYVMELNKTVLGFIGLMHSRDKNLPSNTFEIGAIYFDPDFIGRGYGKRAMAWAKEELISRGATQISLWVLDENHRAKGFYRACGFVPDGATKPSGLGDRLEERMVCRVSQVSSCQHHYDLLIDEGNDPVHDPKALKDYMNRWDGQDFIDRLMLAKNKSVLEIGVGTGRLAVHTAPLCGKFVGIDLSHKTIERAKKNLAPMKHVTLICNDFMTHSFDESYDIIYSSLTFMHISEKEAAIRKAASLLHTGGRFVLSIDKNRSDVIDMGTRKVTIYPDTPDEILCCITAAKLTLIEQLETEAAVIFIAEKQL